MLVIFYLLLMLRVGRCSDDRKFVTKTVGVGQNVTLTCARQESLHQESLFWIRIISGNWPEFLGGTFTFDIAGVDKTPQITTNTHITARNEPGTFVLRISQTKLSDTGFYYCLKITKLKMAFMEGIFLIVKGPEPDITAFTEVSPSDPVHPGDSETLQCSVLSDSDNKTCPEDHSVYWFRAKPDESHPSLIYAHQNSGDECERSPETHSQKCVYSFSKDISSSDAGTYYCAVATCGQIIFGNGTKLDINETNMWSQTVISVIFPLCAVLVISLIVTAFFIYDKCDRCSGPTAVVVRRKKIQRGEDTLVYSAAVFTMMNGDHGGRRNAKAAERERMYMALQAFSLD